MRSRIVEGEPGIFPDPVSRLLVRLFRRLRGRRRPHDGHEPAPASGGEGPGPPEPPEPTGGGSPQGSS